VQVIKKIEGFTFLIQSSVKKCSYLLQRLDKHLDTMLAQVMTITDQEFKKIVDSVMVNASLKDQN
jgi:secreted Zn-dependent insulinase-like peptidase